MKKLFLLAMLSTLLMSPVITSAKSDTTTNNVKVISDFKTTYKITTTDNDGKKTIITREMKSGENTIDSLMKDLEGQDIDFDALIGGPVGIAKDMLSNIFTALLLFFILPVALIIIIIILIWNNKSKKNKMIKDIIIANKEVPTQLLEQQTSPTKRSIKNIFLGIGLGLCVGLITESFLIGVAVGGVAIFIGIGQLIIGKIEKKEKEISESTPKAE